MATGAEVLDSVAALKADLTALRDNDAEVVTKLDAVLALIEQLRAGGPVTQEQLDAIALALSEARTLAGESTTLTQSAEDKADAALA